MMAGCSTQDAQTKIVVQVVILLQMMDEQAEKLKWSRLGEISKEEKVGIEYQADEKTRQEVILSSTEWQTTNWNTRVKEGVKELVDQTTADQPIEETNNKWEATNFISSGRGIYRDFRSSGHKIKERNESAVKSC